MYSQIHNQNVSCLLLDTEIFLSLVLLGHGEHLEALNMSSTSPDGPPANHQLCIQISRFDLICNQIHKKNVSHLLPGTQLCWFLLTREREEHLGALNTHFVTKKLPHTPTAGETEGLKTASCSFDECFLRRISVASMFSDLPQLELHPERSGHSTDCPVALSKCVYKEFSEKEKISSDAQFSC